MKVVRFVGDRRCNIPAYLEALLAEDNYVFDVVSTNQNAILNFTMGSSPVRVPLTRDIRDFVELALFVYIADTLVSREEQSDRWTRTLDFLFPVANPALWHQAESILSETLSTLSGDNYRFEFPRVRTLPPRSRRRQTLPRGFDTVCLFSGGFDSLLGACSLLSEGRRVILVGHHADGVTSSAQNRLISLLANRFPNSFVLVQCSGSASRRSNPRFSRLDIVEKTHRTRSFLFLALGVAIAKATNISSLYIPENGLIALNPPLGLSRVGSLSTRTAHPRFFWHFKTLVEDLGLFNGELKNPFMYQSKTDLAEAMDPDLQSLVLESVSCSHGNLGLLGARSGQRHCGYCIPCLYRRFALAVAGIDNPSHYIKDAFIELESLSAYKQMNLRMLVSFASQVTRMRPAQLQSLVVTHGWFPPQLGGSIGPSETGDYRPWADMLSQWAVKLLEQVDELCSSETKRILGRRYQ